MHSADEKLLSSKHSCAASRIIDGDRLVVSGRKIDLKGIDAPELNQSCHWPKGEIACGLIARSALMDLTAGASLVCEVELKGENGFALGECRASGYDLAEGMAHTGWALATEDAPERYRKAMTGARNAGRALWKGRFTAPWLWRGIQERAAQQGKSETVD
jgi:endonuclease YncB( thermonuclease family)